MSTITWSPIAAPRSRRKRRPLQPLFDQLAEAARQDDRAEFDRLFEVCFGRIYAIAWRIAGDRTWAEAITEHILCEAVTQARAVTEGKAVTEAV